MLDLYQYHVFNKYNQGEEDLFEKYEIIESENGQEIDDEEE